MLRTDLGPAVVLSILLHALLLLILVPAGRSTINTQPALRITLEPHTDDPPALYEVPKPVKRLHAPPDNPYQAQAQVASPPTKISRERADKIQLPNWISIPALKGSPIPSPLSKACKASPALPFEVGMSYEEVLRLSPGPPLDVRRFSPLHHPGSPYVAVEFRMLDGRAYSAVFMDQIVVLHGAMDASNAELQVREVYLAALERSGGATLAEVAAIRLSVLDAIWGARLDVAVRAKYARAVEILQGEARGWMSRAEAQALLSVNFTSSPGDGTLIRRGNC